MDDWKHVVASNLVRLRKANQLTQLQLAEQLHYSDKAVSKWERGESLPDLAVMKQLADFYGIRIDDFLNDPDAPQEAAAESAEDSAVPEPDTEPAAESAEEPVPEAEAVPASANGSKQQTKNRFIIAGMAAVLVWLVASMIFVVLDAVQPELRYSSFLFIYAAPITAVVALVFNSIWFNRRWNFVIISLLIWSVLGALFFTFYTYKIWKLFLIGIPAQLIVVLWSRLRPVRDPK
ncbi:MAG: helix-turn-helix transcriptional regulator [Oscillospiraceae bacterium]|nr:helix-turn-helix transcriptional regulator [Oscillospiraceae bacterium]